MTTKEMIERAGELAKSGRPDEAIALLTQAVQNDPSSAIARRMRGVVYCKWRKDFNRALEDLLQAQRLDPDDVLNFFARADCYIDMKECDLALHDLDAAFLIDCHNPKVYLERGRARYGKGEYERAMTEWRMAVWLAPDNLKWVLERIRDLETCHVRDGAMEEFRAILFAPLPSAPPYPFDSVPENDLPVEVATENSPENLRKHLAIGKEHLSARRWLPAQQELNLALAADPSNAEAYRRRAVTFRALGQLRRAITDLDRAIQLEPLSANNYVNRAEVFTEMKEYERALSDFQTAISLDPTDKMIYNNRGVTYREMGRLEEAIADYRKVLEMSPGEPIVKFNLAMALKHAGHSEEALSSLQRFIEIAPPEMSHVVEHARLIIQELETTGKIADDHGCT